MGDEQLIQLAQSFLGTPEGKKLLGENTDLSSIQKQISILEQSLDNSLSKSSLSSEEKKSLSREERKKLRQEKRQSNRDFREQRRAQRKDERRAQLEELKNRLNDYIPKIETYNIKGRLFDEITGEPLKDVKITALLASIPGKNPTTNSQGEFNINLKVPILPINNQVLTDPQLIYTKSQYVPLTYNLLTRERVIKTDLPTKGMLNVEKAVEKAKSEIQNEIDEKKAYINTLYLEGFEILLVAKRKSIMKVVNIIKTKLVPLAIGQLILFGISKLSQRDQKICPSQSQLEGVINNRNRIARQLNQIYKAIISNAALAVAFTAISQAFRGVRLTVDNLPIPLGAPLGVGQPYNVVSKLQNINDLLKRLEEENKELNKQILIALVFLVAALAIILLLLKGIDELTQECSTQQNIPLETINENLLDLTQEAEEEESPVITQVNGFIMGVETDKNEVGSLNRRYAVAKNPQGVIVLKGEPSFSASDQILIDELVFYIESNNLKAF